MNQIVDLVITEDSDLLAYGCEKVLFKLDPNGWGIEIDTWSDLRRIKQPDFSTFTWNHFLTMCILSGCDYLPSISGVGISKAHQLI